MFTKKKKNSMHKIVHLALLSMIVGLLSIGNAKATETNLPLHSMISVENEAVLSTDTVVFTVCEKMPEYPGGPTALFSYLAEKIQYPAESVQKNEQGRAVVQFIVEKDGSLSNIHIIRSVTPKLDAEAIRVVKSMPKWTPGKQKGKSVRVKYTCPITFRLK